MKKEQIYFLIREHGFRWCKLFDLEGRLIFSYSENEKEPENLINRLEKFLQTFEGKFTCNFKEKSNATIENTFEYILINGIEQKPIMQGVPVDEEKLRKSILTQIKEEQKIEQEKEALKIQISDIKQREKELQDWGTKLMTVLEFAGSKLLEKYSPLLENILNPQPNKMTLAGTETNTNELTETEQVEVIELINRALVHMSVRQLRSLVEYIEKDPKILNSPFVSPIFNN